jgi:hypothetical protein
MVFRAGQPIILKYPVQISRTGIKSQEDHYVLNWPNGIPEEIPSRIMEESFKKYHSEITETVQEKIDNTLQFYSDVRGWTGVESLPDRGYYVKK